MGGDPTEQIRDFARMLKGWDDRPYFMAALVRSVETGHAASGDGVDELMLIPFQTTNFRNYSEIGAKELHLHA